MNAKMPELKRCFEAAGFTNVRDPLLSSGNVVLRHTPRRSELAIARKAGSRDVGVARSQLLGPVVRPVARLQA
jgi:hypothetical protein